MRRRKVVWHASAVSDLDYLVEHLKASGSHVNAAHVVDRLDDLGASLSMSAERGRIVPEFAAHGIVAYREVIDRPWRLIYRVEPREVIILTIVDSRRRLDELLLQRLVRADP